jgi:hypothetical protein
VLDPAVLRALHEGEAFGEFDVPLDHKTFSGFPGPSSAML